MDDRVVGLDLSELGSQLGRLVRQKLWAQIVLGMVAGVALGLAIAPTGGGWASAEMAERLGDWLALPGELFLTTIRMIVVPLVVASIVLGIADRGDLGEVRRLAMWIVPYFLASTTAAVFLGIAVSYLIDPGHFIVAPGLAEAGAVAIAPPDPLSVPERIVAILPSNPLGALLEESMLQIVVFALICGVALASLEEERARALLDLARTVQALAMKVVSWAMRLAPIAAFGLMARLMIDAGLEAILGLGAYMGTVLLGLASLIVLYLVVVRVVARRPVGAFLSAIRDAQLLAFSTSSSAAVMPVSLRTAEEKLGVRPSVARFVIPVGATVNMDGTALYQVCAALFLAGAFGVELTFSTVLLLAMTTVGASIGSPSAPGVGIAILATVLSGIGIPVEGVALIIGVDRLLDMTRTVVNVTGDLTACVVIDRLTGAR